MRAIYEPRGRAGEYAELAANLYDGCEHGCTYCYAPLVLHRDRSEYHEHAEPRAGVLVVLERDAAKLAGDSRPVLLCFTCDPYGPGDTSTTRAAIEVLHRHDLRVTVLSKGGTRACRDVELFGPGDSYGATLTTLDPAPSLEWEPRAALPADRLAALEAFHTAGIHTWVSLEPVLDPDASLRIIEETHDYVELYKLGTLNYHEHSRAIDWATYGCRAAELLEALGKDYVLKDDLRRHLHGVSKGR